MAVHQNVIEIFVIFILTGAGLHLTVSAETAEKTVDGKYSRPVVYTNLPPPVLYFPKFPEKPKIARGDAEDKSMEYVPFPYKDLPLLVYQSDNQPPVHVVQKTASQDVGRNEQSQPSNTPYRSNEANTAQQTSASDYMHSNGRQYQITQMLSSPQENSKERYMRINVPVANLFPDLENQQYQNIGLSSQQEEYPETVLYRHPQSSAQPSSNPTSHLQQNQNTQHYEVQSGLQQSGQQKNASSQMQNAPKYSIQQPQMQYIIQTSGEQNFIQMQSPSNENSNKQNEALQQTQQNMGYQYPQSMMVQYQMHPIRNAGTHSQYGTQQMSGQLKQSHAQIQYSPNNGQQAPYSGEQSNSQQPTSSGMQKLFYHPIADDNSHLNSLQQLDISLSTVQQPSLSVNGQQMVVVDKMMQQNVAQMIQQNMPQAMQQKIPQKMQLKQQAQTSAENDSDDNDPQYISIAVYPYDISDNNQVQEAQQYYNVAIPKYSQYQNENHEEPNQMNQEVFNINLKEKQQIPQQVQGYQYTNAGSSTPVRQNGNQQRNAYTHANKHTIPSKVNAANDVNSQKKSNKHIQMQSQQNSSENPSKGNSMEYQKIIINIPHTSAAPPQILIQQNDKNQPATPYTGTAQVTGNLEGSNKFLATTNNLRQSPQYPPLNVGYHMADFSGPSAGLNQGKVRPSVLTRFPMVKLPGLYSHIYPPNILRNPFGHNLGGYTSIDEPHYRIRHPVYASSNVHYTSANPFLFNHSFRKNMQRFPYPIPFNQGSAAMLKPSFLQSPVRFPLNFGFRSSFPEEMIAEASFHYPSITRSRKDELNNTNTNNEGFSSTEINHPNYPAAVSGGQVDIGIAPRDESTAKLLQKITRDVLTHDVLDGVYSDFSPMNPGQNVMATINRPQLSEYININHGGQSPGQAGKAPVAPLLPLQHKFTSNSPSYVQNQSDGKYGNFIKKLAALSSSLLSQSFGRKPQITSRESPKVQHHNGGFSVEEINESLLPENASPRVAIVKPDHQAFDGISVPVSGNNEFLKRVSKQESSLKPPIIVYEGPKPPLEVYGTKDDIEDVNHEVDQDPLETSAAEQHSVSRLAVDDNEPDPERILDYVDIMYSMLPDFIKHSIGTKNDDFSTESVSGGWLPLSISTPMVNLKDELASIDETGSNLSTSESEDVLPATNSSRGEAASAFEEDIEELLKLLPKEEKSDIVPF